MAPPPCSKAPDAEPSELTLVTAARAGDEDALGQLMRRCLPMARALAVRSGCRPEDMEDVVQDATAEAVALLPRLRQPEAFGTWFGQIVIFVTRAYQRRERLRRRLGIVTAGSAGAAIEDVAATAPTPERNAEMRELEPVAPLPTILTREVQALERRPVLD